MKNIKKILLLIICCFLNVNFCYAVASISVNYNDPNRDADGGSHSTHTDTDDDGMINESYTSGNYTCNYDYEFTQTTTVDIYGYDAMNESIIDVQVTPNKSIKAGTSIGIGIVESKTATWRYEFNVTEEVCLTEYEYEYVCDLGYINDRKESKYVWYKYGAQIDSGCSSTGKKRETSISCKDIPVKDENNEVYKECEKNAIASSQGAAGSFVGSPSYTDIKLLNPNDVDATDQFSITSKGCTDSCSSSPCSCKHVYTPKSVCMNKITSEVRYGTADNCEENEFQIKNDVIESGGKSIEHFHYFVPLNVTSGWFSLVLSESPDLQDANWCKKAIDANPTNYADFFVGAPSIVGGNTIPLPADNVEQAKRSVENGCFIKTEIRIPVSDGIYNVDVDNKINGYNFYVKNVSESNPFPYPVTNTDSLWFEWYQNNYYDQGNYAYNNVEPNIKTSFKDKSYLVENVDAKTVRNINKKYKDLKTSYLNASLLENGTSTFINGEEGLTITRYDTSYYKLGCGPINSGDAASNPLYQEGC